MSSFDYFKEKGFEYYHNSLKKRLENLLLILGNSDTSYPLSLRMWGFTKLNIESKEELGFRIQELSEVIDMQVEKNE